jgi:TPR repeat protein
MFHRVVRLALAAAALLPAAPSLATPRARAFTVDAAYSAMKRGDFDNAMSELKPLAAKGDPDAEFLLGMLYDSGKGVARNQATAASWYRKAAEQKHLFAQVYLGALYYSGQGVKQNYGEAARWFRGPAAAGNDQAQFYLGSMYANGAGVGKDGTEAIRWLTKSAQQRNTRAMGLLATELFSRSQGSDEHDLIDAYVWSHLAAEYDPIQAATSARKVIERNCSNEQRKKAERSIAERKRQWAGAHGAPGR